MQKFKKKVICIVKHQNEKSRISYVTIETTFYNNEPLAKEPIDATRNESPKEVILPNGNYIVERTSPLKDIDRHGRYDFTLHGTRGDNPLGE